MRQTCLLDPRAETQDPYIARDDVLKRRIHRTKDSKPFFDAVKDVTKSGESK